MKSMFAYAETQELGLIATNNYFPLWINMETILLKIWLMFGLKNGKMSFNCFWLTNSLKPKLFLSHKTNNLGYFY